MSVPGTRRHLLGAAVAATTVALTLSACGSGSGGSGGTASGGNSADNTLTVSYSQTVADELPIWIADEAGYFKKQGLNVTLTNLSSSDGFPALIAGQTQLASIGAFVAELSGAISGVGVLMNTAGQQFQTSVVFAGLFIFALTGVLLTGLLRRVERHFAAWRPATH